MNDSSGENSWPSGITFCSVPNMRGPTGQTLVVWPPVRSMRYVCYSIATATREIVLMYTDSWLMQWVASLVRTVSCFVACSKGATNSWHLYNYWNSRVIALYLKITLNWELSNTSWRENSNKIKVKIKLLRNSNYDNHMTHSSFRGFCNALYFSSPVILIFFF